MRTKRTNAALVALFALISACQPADDRSAASPGPSADTSAASAEAAPTAPSTIAATPGADGAFAAITADETIRLTGTEPFWGGTIRGAELVYSTPENQNGETIAVQRFAGNNGLGFSGSLGGAALDLTVTPGKCSDGMSDRTYPFTATLRIGEDQRNGCAWTERMPFTGFENP